MADLSTWANIAEIVGGATVVGAAGFAVLQIHEFRRQRAESAALNFIQSIQDDDSFWASRFLATLPDGATKEQVRAMGPEAERAVNRVYMMFETLGYRVYRRLVPLELADEMAGGTIRLAYTKLHRYIEEERREFGPNAFEWFQWLAEQTKRHPAPGKADGAHVSYKGWRP